MNIISKIIKLYDYSIIEKPYISFFLALSVILFFSLSIPNFKMDASADSLVLENDNALKYYRATSARYGTEDFVVVTFKPNNGIYNKESLSKLDNLAKEIKINVDGVSEVLTILDVPLLNSPKIGFSDLANEQRTLRSDDIDLNMVKQEFLSSPLYKNLLMSQDSSTTVLVVYFSKDKKYFDLLNNRNSLRELELNRELTQQEEISLENFELEFKNYSSEFAAKEKENIKKMREVVSNYKEDASIFLGGVPMITSDMTDFIAEDIKKFGVGVFIFLILILFAIFRSVRWIMIPLFGCII